MNSSHDDLDSGPQEIFRIQTGSAGPVSAIVYFRGAICWLFIDPVTRLEKKAED